MQSKSELDELHDLLAQYKPENMAEIIDKLSGGKDNLRVDIRKVRLTIRGTKLELNGKVNLNVIHKKLQPKTQGA